MSVSVFWFRRDLRLFDNHGLSEALASGKPVLALFIFDETILSNLTDKKDKRVCFIYETLSQMNDDLVQLGSSLKVYHSTPLEAFKDLTRSYEIEGVYTNNDYEPYARKRDQEIAKFLEEKEIPFKSYKDQCIFEKDEVVKDDQKPYTVYTPYMKKWIKTLRPNDLKTFPTQGPFFQTKPFKFPSLKSLGFETTQRKFPSSEVDLKILKNYDKNRDFPALGGTSQIGIHLRFGTVSIRYMVKLAKSHNAIWLKELIWREFFMQILWHFPKVEKKSFREEYDEIKWLGSASDFKAWKEGKTGYPMVDAGMRELNQTGYMHNRVRMVTASFLTKHLLIDWRKGERYFAEKLLDYDLAANNGNWQWAAGCGCDAAPYFRIFNPEMQQKKFDPDFEYIKKWVPEYGTAKYAEPIIDHNHARKRALLTYKEGLGKI